MVTLLLPAPKDVSRKRKAHKKSRRGCGNCKLRGVKCDETKPECKRCRAFSVSCNYDPKSSTDLQLSVNGAFKIEILQNSLCSPNQAVVNTINAQFRQQSTEPRKSNAVYQLKGQDLELLSKFRSRTVLTLGAGKSAHVFRNEVVRLTSLYPYLMHMVLTVTLLHDRYLYSGSSYTKMSAAEAYHLYQGTALFNKKISQPMQLSEREALWSTSTLLGLVAFACIEATTPEEAWPLKPPSSIDLEWLRMSDGKKAMFKLADPLRAGSVFQVMAAELGKNGQEEFVQEHFLPTCWLTEPELENLPVEFVKIYNLDARSTVDKNPYQTPASDLARLLSLPCRQNTILKFLDFLNKMPQDYKQLLQQKDPRALLLLAYWYAKACQYKQWWIQRRALLECQAICIYLERYHADQTDIQKLLQFPRIMCGCATPPLGRELPTQLYIPGEDDWPINLPVKLDAKVRHELAEAWYMTP